MPDPAAKLRTITLELDDLDYDAIQAEFALRQSRSRWPDEQGGTILPEGESNLAGAMVAEIIRELQEYRDIHQV